MQMLAGVITESEYKEKLEEADPGNLMLSNAAKQIYQYIKSNKYNVMLQIDGKVIGADKNAPFTLYSDSKSGKISVRGIGSDQNTVKDTMTKLQNLILGHFNFLEKDGEIQVNFDGMKNASLGSFALRIKPDMLKKGEVTEALNEHYVAGGIVGIGAITQIPSRAKTDYEDAFEYFLNQKYSINEEMESDNKVEAFLDDMINTSIPEDSEEGEEINGVWEAEEYADEDAYGEAAQEFKNAHEYIMGKGGETTIEGNPDVTYKALPNGDIAYRLIVTLDEAKKMELNEDSLEKTISFGPYTNLTYYDQPREDTVYLVVDTSDNFTKIIRAVDTKGKDFYTKKQILYLNDKLDDLAEEMSDYLTKQGIENEVVDNQLGYGQDIDNLEIEISKDDLSKLK